MIKRLFIAINLPEKIKEELSLYQSKYSEIPARWVRKKNIHITLFFIGVVSEKDFEKIKEVARRAVQKIRPFGLEIIRVVYAFPELKIPRMIWASLNHSDELFKLRKEIENTKMVNITDEREFKPHITLARIKEWEFKKINLEEIPQIDDDFSLKFKVNSIELMESKPIKGVTEYIILESIPFTQ